jgi:hypothetical protein
VTRQYAIVEAPSVLGLRPTGVETLPDALIGAGLDAQLGARRAGRVEPPPYDDRRDPETLMLNPQGIADYTPTLADAITEVLKAGDFPSCSAGIAASSLGASWRCDGVAGMGSCMLTATQTSISRPRTPTARRLRPISRWRPAADPAS